MVVLDWARGELTGFKRYYEVVGSLVGVLCETRSSVECLIIVL